MEKRDRWALILWIAALGNLANGLWMLADPEGWYWRLPAAVPDTGPLNEHFVRDIGCAFTVMSAGLIAAALRPAARTVLVSVVALFYVMHAAVHVYDTARGLLPPNHWTIDFPGVYVPALLMIWFVAALARTGEARA